MWPKAFAQLIELLPHVSRLIPMADNFFASRNAAQQAGEKFSQTALSTLADTVHNDLARITANHDGLAQQLGDQTTRLTEIAADLKRSRLSIDRDAEQLSALEQKLGTLTTWVKALAVLLLLAIALLIAIFVLAARA